MPEDEDPGSALTALKNTLEARTGMHCAEIGC